MRSGKEGTRVATAGPEAEGPSDVPPMASRGRPVGGGDPTPSVYHEMGDNAIWWSPASSVAVRHFRPLRVNNAFALATTTSTLRTFSLARAFRPAAELMLAVTRRARTQAPPPCETADLPYRLTM
jgi:hypothetical protein